jgi:hypothetical protein
MSKLFTPLHPCKAWRQAYKVSFCSGMSAQILDHQSDGKPSRSAEPLQRKTQISEGVDCEHAYRVDHWWTHRHRARRHQERMPPRKGPAPICGNSESMAVMRIRKRPSFLPQMDPSLTPRLLAQRERRLHGGPHEPVAHALLLPVTTKHSRFRNRGHAIQRPGSGPERPKPLTGPHVVEFAQRSRPTRSGGVQGRFTACSRRPPDAGASIAETESDSGSGPALCMSAGRSTPGWIDLPIGPGQALGQKRGQRLHLGAAGARRGGDEIEAAEGHAPIGKQGFHLACP